MKLLELFFFPGLVIAYGIYLLYFVPKNGNFADIAGAIMVMLGGGGLLLAAMLWFVAKKLNWPNKTYIRLFLGLLGLVLSYVILLLYVSMVG
ncbi:hypothetical protein IT418_03460 [bacterium]|nr:hypothetical protein [bacterium]